MRTYFTFTRLCLVLVAVLGLVVTVQADLVILKDGFALQGKVLRQTSTTFEPGAGILEFAKLNGFYWVEDGARRMIFSPRQVPDNGLDERDLNRTADIVRLSREVRNLDGFKIPAGSIGVEVTPFDAKWERNFKIQAPTGTINIAQRLVTLTPHFARVESLRYDLAPCYLTRELDPQVVRELLYQHPQLKLTGKAEDPAKRFRVARFFVQAERFDFAEREYASILKEFPDQRDKVESARENLRKLKLNQALDELEQAQRGGRHAWVQRQFSGLPTNDLDERQIARIQALKSVTETGGSTVLRARRYLRELPDRLVSQGTRETFSDAATAIAQELTIESMARLEPFLQQAKSAEPGAKTEVNPERLLALAITGWLLGPNSAEPKVDAAVRLWRARQLVLDYQRSATSGARDRVGTLLQTSGVPFDELAQVIRHSPPPEPYPLMAAQAPVIGNILLQGATLTEGLWPSALAPWAVACGSLAAGQSPGATTLRLTTDGLPPSLLLTHRRGIRYQLQLPPEYHPGRACPVLFVLHAAGETNEQMLRKWETLAAHHGYLLVAPEWGSGFRTPYDYSPEEHASVVDVLRDLRRRFQVDSDRVFLFGWGEGGNMAYDVGLSHPDLFAGVMPMAAKPRYFAKIYWKNGQHLPFYVMDGFKNGDSPVDNRKQFEHWVRTGAPSLYIEYKGRAAEWFGGELPILFDWMGRKKRSQALPEIGKSGGGSLYGEEFQIHRPTDDHFYWLSVKDVNDRNTNEAGRWRAGAVPGSLHGRISEGNQINVTARGFRKLTVWLGPGMIDFDKNVKIYVNQQQRLVNRKVTPSLATLIEDFWQRGDRQRLFWARVDITL